MGRLSRTPAFLKMISRQGRIGQGHQGTSLPAVGSLVGVSLGVGHPFNSTWEDPSYLQGAWAELWDLPGGKGDGQPRQGTAQLACKDMRLEPYPAGWRIGGRSPVVCDPELAHPLHTQRPSNEHHVMF